MGDIVVEPSAAPAETNEEAVTSRRPDDDIKCTVCMGAEFSQECRVHGCKHSFCFSCISEWVSQALRPSCPMCRQDVLKVSYDFRNHDNGRVEIFIKEYRANHMALSPMDRAQMIGERRLVVRNLVYAYKLKAQLAGAIEEQSAAEETNEVLMKSLIDVMEDVSKHVDHAEVLLMDLRTDVVHKDKAIVCNTQAFRRMIYTLKIKVKYPDLRRAKLLADDVRKNPDRFRGFITEFLNAEFEFIPVNFQPNPGGFEWNTNFLGSSLDEDKKKNFASRIYELMMENRPGNEQFQQLLVGILPNVSLNHITILDDHLEAILSVESTNFTEFYNKVYYDSNFNSLPEHYNEFQNMMNAMRMMRDNDQEGTFDAFFNPRGEDWVNEHMFTERMFRQMINSDRTDLTDRATNNDDTSDRSMTPPEERVPTPMPDDGYTGVYHTMNDTPPDNSFDTSPSNYDLLRDSIRHVPRGLRSSEGRPVGLRARRGMTREEAINSFRSIPNRSANRQDEIQNSRIRELERRTELLSNMFHPPPVLEDQTNPLGRQRLATSSSIHPLSRVPVYHPSTPSLPTNANSPARVHGTHNMRMQEIAEMMSAQNAADRAAQSTEASNSQRIRRLAFPTRHGSIRYRAGNMDVTLTPTENADIDVLGMRRAPNLTLPVWLNPLNAMRERPPSHSSSSRETTSNDDDRSFFAQYARPNNEVSPNRASEEPFISFWSRTSPGRRRSVPRSPTDDLLYPAGRAEPSVADIAASIDQEDANAGLDYISVAHRTRAARRAAASGQLPGAPPTKISPNRNNHRD